MISGEIFEKRLHPFLDNELGASEISQINEYLDMNPDEKARVDDLRELIADLQALPEVPLPENFHYKAYAKITAAQHRARNIRIAWRSAVAMAAAFVLLCAGAFSIERFMPPEFKNAGSIASSEIEKISRGNLDLNGAQVLYGSAIPEEEAINDEYYEQEFAAALGDSMEAEYDIEYEGASDARDISVQSASDTGFQAKISRGSPIGSDPQTGANTESESGLSPQELAANRGLKIIRSADVSIQTRDFDGVVTLLRDEVEKASGYYEYSYISGDPAKSEGFGSRTANFTARIPAKALDGFITSMKVIEGVSQISENNRDITAQYVDTQTRLQTLHNQYSRLEELSQKAVTVTQLIEVEREMQAVLYNIESYTGDLNHWDMQVEYSTVTLYVSELTPQDRIIVADESLGTRIRAAFYGAVNGFIAFLENTVIWVVSVLPVLIIVLTATAIILTAVISSKRYKKKTSD